MTLEREAILRVRDLRAGYGDRVILDGVSFDVYAGEVFAILGGSGCGKSTLLKSTLGLVETFHGTVEFQGQNLLAADGAARSKLLSRLGVTYQDGALFGSMTLAENVAVPLEEHTNLDHHEREAIARVKLQLVGLAGFASFLPNEISGGMRKRAAIARAMALDPPLLMLDEPSAGLDPVTSAGLDRLIARLAETLGITFVIVTHELPSILSVVDRCILLDRSVRGIVETGDPKVLLAESQDRVVRDFFDRRAEDDAFDPVAPDPEATVRQKTNYVLIGVFVLASATLAVIGAVLLGASALGRDSLILETYIRESVTGLEVGAHVRFRGVKIGSVTEIGYTSQVYGSADPLVLVRFAISPQNDTQSIRDINEIVTERLDAGLRARLASQGLTGALYLEADLYDDPDVDPIEVTWMPEYRYVPSIPSTINRISGSLEELLGNLAVADFASLFDSVRSTLDTIEGSVRDAELPELAKSIREVADTAKASLAKLDTAIETLSTDGSAALGGVRRTFDAVDPEELKALVANLEQFSAGLEPTRRALDEAVAQLGSTLNGRGRDLDQILENVRRISVGLANLTDTLERYPSLMLFGNPPPERSNR